MSTRIHTKIAVLWESGARIQQTKKLSGSHAFSGKTFGLIGEITVLSITKYLLLLVKYRLRITIS